MGLKSFFKGFATGKKSLQKRDTFIPAPGTTSIMTINEFLERLVGAQDAILVNREQSLHIPVIHACIDLIASTLAQLPLYLYKKSGNTTEKAINHKYYKTLNLKPNSYQTSYDFRYSMAFNLLLFGNAYALIRKDGNGDPCLLPIESPRVKIRVRPSVDFKSQEYYYQISRTYSSEVEATARPDEMIHFKWSVNGPLEGADTFYRIRETASLSMSLRRFGLQFFKNAMNSNFAIIFPEGKGDDAMRNIRKDLKERYSGVRNTAEPMVFEENPKIQQLDMNLLQAQYNELCTATDKDLCRFYRVQPHMVGIMDSATFSNIEQQAMEFVKHTLMPWIVRIEQEFNSKLLDVFEQDDYFFKFHVDGLLRGDTLSRSQAQVLQVNNGLRTINEVRDDDEKNPVEGGDETRVPMNIADATKANDEVLNVSKDKEKPEPKKTK